MKNLINRLATGALILGGALTSFSQMGCGSPDIDPVHREQELAAARLFGGLLEASPKSSRREAAVGRAIYNSAENQADRNAYGNQNGSNDNSGETTAQEVAAPQSNYAQQFLDKVAREKLVFFRWDDANRDGTINIDSPNETIFTDVFYEGETIAFAFQVPTSSKLKLFMKASVGGGIQEELLNSSSSQSIILFRKYTYPRIQRGQGTITNTFELHLDSENGPLYSGGKIFIKEDSRGSQ